ncbi:hypothetical protein RO3G_02947 [Rhizopus delemar RA 99-880]|uniref:Uncharacterized protein n=1 Tax=Rhizopus delemar (strain RA 99-880 / ATCC MYA-4621 / FGSC 9543 / NRRL 43880) TaxID=246409 RepID=I1BPW3_RHIO9|nr:hypothetical protein RO3G_02947 [Rhizopus delemar RA 99-880]|eukprot:EIE78243.1 hypothetical protein RO3G_02947 [Rhizopus delemar RA 99-880]
MLETIYLMKLKALGFQREFASLMILDDVMATAGIPQAEREVEGYILMSNPAS